MDGIERELGDRAQVLRISVTGGTGGQLAARYGVRGVPMFVLLDGTGTVVLAQVGMPDRGAIVAAVEGILEQ